MHFETNIGFGYAGLGSRRTLPRCQLAAVTDRFHIALGWPLPLSGHSRVGSPMTAMSRKQTFGWTKLRAGLGPQRSFKDGF